MIAAAALAPLSARSCAKQGVASSLVAQLQATATDETSEARPYRAVKAPIRGQAVEQAPTPAMSALLPTQAPDRRIPLI